jgi:hypothetical protein
MECIIHGTLTKKNTYIWVEKSKTRRRCLLCNRQRANSHYATRKTIVSKRNKKKYRENPSHYKAKAMKYKVLLRFEALNKYSGGRLECAKCEETEYRFLCLDHLDNDGAIHRKTLKAGGHAIYGWVKKAGYPAGFQVLCHNCNHLKHILTIQTKSSFIRSAVREKVLREYADPIKCALCDVSDIRVLTIDHIHGGGNAHLREIGVRGGTAFYCWLKKNEFPNGFRVLCFNHNLGACCRPRPV